MSSGGARWTTHFIEIGLAHLVAVIYEANTASRTVATRIGITHQGPISRYDTTCELLTATRATP